MLFFLFKITSKFEVTFTRIQIILYTHLCSDTDWMLQVVFAIQNLTHVCAYLVALHIYNYLHSINFQVNSDFPSWSSVFRHRSNVYWQIYICCFSNIFMFWHMLSINALCHLMYLYTSLFNFIFTCLFILHFSTHLDYKLVLFCHDGTNLDSLNTSFKSLYMFRHMFICLLIYTHCYDRIPYLHVDWVNKTITALRSWIWFLVITPRIQICLSFKLTIIFILKLVFFLLFY